MVQRDGAPTRQRNTRQAVAIETALGGADGFRSAQELHTELRAEGDRVGLSTVYRYLTLLAEQGRADVVHGADGEARYRLCGTPHQAAGDEPDAHHHHLVCRECGRSEEVAAPQVEAWAARVAGAAGYTEVTHTVELFGLCPQHSRPGRPKRRAAATTATTRPAGTARRRST